MKLGPAYRILTPRLIIRCYELDDAPLLLEAVDGSADHLKPWMPWAYHEPRTLDGQLDLVRKFRGDFDLGNDLVYAIFDRTETRLLGDAVCTSGWATMPVRLVTGCARMPRVRDT